MRLFLRMLAVLIAMSLIVSHHEPPLRAGQTPSQADGLVDQAVTPPLLAADFRPKAFDPEKHRVVTRQAEEALAPHAPQVALTASLREAWSSRVLAFPGERGSSASRRFSPWRIDQLICTTFTEYHLAAKPLYDALGEKDNRNRRERQPSTIKNKIMGLDFVLDHPQHHYLATEREKLDYFVGTRKSAPENLPTRWYQSPRGKGATAKHFVDKYPMFLSVPPSGTAPVVHFCYVDEGMQSTDGFATHLDQYSRLLAALPDFRVIYIAQHDDLFGSARRVFDAFWAQLTSSDGAAIDPETRQLLEYFDSRQQYEAGDFSRFDTAGLIRYREDKKRFTGERFEALYERWRAGGAAAVLEVLNPGQPTKDLPVERFSTYVLEYDYDLFGTLTSARQQAGESTSIRTHP